jgi:hypothetical protein
MSTPFFPSPPIYMSIQTYRTGNDKLTTSPRPIRLVGVVGTRGE